MITCSIMSCRRTYTCNSCSSDYHDYTYNIVSKEYIACIKGDSIYKADILIRTSRQTNPLDSLFPDSLICFALSICKKERLVEASFFTDMRGLQILDHYGIKNAKESEIGKADDMTRKDYQMLLMTTFGYFEAKRLNANWDNQITSDNISIFIPRRIYFKGDPIRLNKLIVK